LQEENVLRIGKYGMKQLVCAQDIRNARTAGQTRLVIPAGAVITPQARDDARSYGITLTEEAPPVAGQAGSSSLSVPVASRPAAAPLLFSDLQRPIPQTGTDPLALKIRSLVAAELGPAADMAAIASSVNTVLAERRQAAGEPGNSGVCPVQAGDPVEELTDAVLVRGGEGFPPQGAKPVRGTAVAEVLTPDARGPGIGYLSFAAASFEWTFAHAEVLVVLEGELLLSGNGMTLRAGPGDVLRIHAGAVCTLSASGPVRCVYSAWPA
jgi:uncharacterized cupin superfamily protein